MTPVVLFVGPRTAEQHHAVLAAGRWTVLSLIAVFADLSPEQLARLRRSVWRPVLRLPLERLMPHAIAWAL